jgi:hypothetical protein
MQKIDLKKSLKEFFTAPLDDFILIDVPALQFLKVDGQGDPSVEPSYKNAVEWLYSTAYGIKFAAKAALARDFVVAPLEGLWWADDPESFVARRKAEWQWTMMIMMPDFVTGQLAVAAAAKAEAKLGARPPSLRLESLEEGLSLQALHIGSYDAEGPLLASLHHRIMPARGYTFAGPHHEIYLSDPRRTEPGKLRTILRQPVVPLAAA